MTPFRFVFYIQIFLLLPFFIYLNCFLSKGQELDCLEMQTAALETKIALQTQRGALNAALASHYKGKDIRKREELISEKLFRQVHFIEGRIEKGASFQEVPAQLAKPLVLNGAELKLLLALLEERTIPPFSFKNFPALCLITDITLVRTEEEGREFFQTNLKLLKREFS